MQRFKNRDTVRKKCVHLQIAQLDGRVNSMRRPALYSSSGKPGGQEAASPEVTSSSKAAPDGAARGLRKHLRLNNFYLLWSMLGFLALMLAISLLSGRPGERKLTQEDINAAVLKTLETTQLPSAAAKAYDTIIPSVVRVVGYGKDKDGKDSERSVGTGVVIVDKGIILTNLHVVQGAETIHVTFADGMTSTASITGAQPENDLAVLQAHKIPDDMIAATMRSTADLRPGDQVMAVGYPFGIGPSASSGVVSGLKRNFRSPDGQQMMSNLIQFDAAANPGNSGGPLVTMDGEVVGIVTAIYNPNQQRTFVGIGFAVPIENAASAAGMPPF
jgi:S1-C subfamily serine protease